MRYHDATSSLRCSLLRPLARLSIWPWAPHATACYALTASRTQTNEPGIDFDEVEFHRVCARRQAEGLLDLRPLALDIVTAAKLEFAARSDFAAVPALEIVHAVKTRNGDWEHCCQ